MGILDQVTEMRNQGLSEAEMNARLQEQGFSPKAINDAFNQERIKSAVSAESAPEQEDYQNPSSETFYQPRTQEQQDYQNYSGQVPGLPGDTQEYQDPYSQQQYPQEQYSQEQYPQDPYSQQQYYQDPYAQQPQYQQPQGEEYYPAEQQYPQEQYSQEQYPQDPYYQDPYAQQTQGYSTDTIIEISEQVFAEKIKKIEKQVEKFAEFAELAQTKISDNNERIKRMESVMDKLQISILDKIGSYGKDIGSIKKEMEMIEDSFTKVIPELKKHKTPSSNAHKKTSSSTKKSSSKK
jgi:hypothetical protein